jgi:predicted RNase H-like HicB family nuclease
MKLRIMFEPDEDGWITAYSPDLPGCVSQGRGIADAKMNIKEAMEGFLEVLLEDAIAEYLKKYEERRQASPKISNDRHVEAQWRIEAMV